MRIVKMSIIEANMKRAFLLAVFLLTTLFVAHPTFASERIKMGTTNLSGQTGDDHGVTVSVTLREGDYAAANPSKGEKAEFVISSPREGDHCDTNLPPSSDTGVVTGKCYATKPGSVSVHAKSIDRGDSSEDVTLEFSDTPAAEPTKSDPNSPAANQEGATLSEAQKAAAMKQYQAQQAGQAGQQAGGTGSTIANQPGLAEDKDTGMAGLAQGNVAGAATTNTTNTDNSPRNDLDLINALIYLAGGIILIIACLYFIWVQMKEHQLRMERKNTSASDAPPSSPTAQSAPTPITSPLAKESKQTPTVQVQPVHPPSIQPPTSDLTKTSAAVDIIARNAMRKSEDAKNTEF
jgi:hypothetical protein